MKTNREAKRIELLEQLHENCRQLLRYNGIDKERSTKAWNDMTNSTYAVNDFNQLYFDEDEEEG
jgi:hypothetical protein